VAIEVLKQTGPMAVSSANVTGHPPARTAAEANEQLGESVSVYLESFPSEDLVASTIIDVTVDPPRVLRDGAVSLETLREVIPAVLGVGEEASAQDTAPGEADDAVDIETGDLDRADDPPEAGESSEAQPDDVPSRESNR
jgi:L-threonylcarbamoyladenylate synthase